MTTERSILITGCSTGIGHAAAIALKQRGWRVFAAARRLEDVQKLSELGLESVQLDVNDSASIHKAVETVLKATGGTLDALFNNAGLLVAGACEDIDNDLLRKQFETNVFGVMELTRQVLPTMRKQGHGRIVQNSSILGIITLPYYGAYNASKFALEGFSNTLRQELRGTGIWVAIINPGPIQSDLRSNAHRTFQETVGQNQESLHHGAYQNLEQSYFKPNQTTQRIQNKPDAVIKQLIHAIESKHPNVHYYIGWPARLMAFAKRVLSDKQLDWLLTKISGTNE